MANGGTATPTFTAVGEFDTITNTVYTEGAPNPYLYCPMIEKNSGIMPDKAKLRLNHELINNNGIEWECNSPNTLNALAEYDKIPLFGERVGIETKNGLVFAGNITSRNDNGSGDTILLEATSDIELLNKIFIRGAVVKDETETSGAYEINFLSRYTTSMNPNGMWNCIGHTVDIAGHPLNGVTVPVFSARALKRQNYDSPDDTFSSELRDNVITAWTPKRALKYFYFVMHLGFGGLDEEFAADIPGLSATSWRSLRESIFFSWDYTTITKMDGSEPSSGEVTSTIDPLDRKLPAMDFQGMPALYAIDKVLTSAGTHEMKGTPVYDKAEDESEEPTTKSFKTSIDFFPIGLTGSMDGKTTNSDIPVMVSGKASWLPNALTGIDFQLVESVLDRRSAVLIEGDIVRSETRLVLGAGIKKAWTPQEELAFSYVIWGGVDAAVSNHEYAKYPITQALDGSDIPSFNDWVLADGESGRQLAKAKSPQAVQLARSLFPRVFKAFRIDSTDSSVTEALQGFIGSDGATGRKYSDSAEYPIGKINRPVLENQLQFQLLDANKSEGGGTGNNWIEERLPVRVEVENDSKWLEVDYVSLQNLGDGVFIISMAEEYDNKPQCIYDGQLYASMPGEVNSLEVTLKSFRLNIAIPTDHRLSGYQTSGILNSDSMLVDFKYDLATGGTPLQYIDSVGGYHEEMQVNSTPSPYQKYQSDDGTTTTGALNRFVPPGSEQSNIDEAAARRLYQTQKIRRTGSWTMMGIRQDYDTGTWIQNVRQIAVDSSGAITDAYPPYNMNAPIMSLVFDFEMQKTMINGLIGE